MMAYMTIESTFKESNEVNMLKVTNQDVTRTSIDVLLLFWRLYSKRGTHFAFDSTVLVFNFELVFNTV